MPRYYFNIVEHQTLIQDKEGQEFPDLRAARFEARCSARDIAIQELRSDREVDGRKIQITDDSGTVLDVLPVKDVVKSLGN